MTLANARRLMPDRARAVRLAAGISVRQLAQAIGVQPSTLSRWERGLRRPRPEQAKRWCALIERLARTLGPGGTP